jgi:hypothetical protein
MNMNNSIITHTSLPLDSAILASIVLQGDLSKLNPQQKVSYYNSLCERIGLDPATQPFKLLNLKGKEILYADKTAAQQLNRMYKISHEIMRKDTIQDVYCVTVRASNANGFQDEDGAVSIAQKKGEELANAFMKAATKAKRRATLALCGLSMLDESELDTLPDATTLPLPEASNSVSIDKNETVEPFKEIESNSEPIPLEETLSEKEKLGKYVFYFGIHKGKSLEDLSELQLKRTLDWCRLNNKYPETQKAIIDFLEAGDLPF